MPYFANRTNHMGRLFSMHSGEKFGMRKENYNASNPAKKLLSTWANELTAGDLPDEGQGFFDFILAAKQGKRIKQFVEQTESCIKLWDQVLLPFGDYIKTDRDAILIGEDRPANWHFEVVHLESGEAFWLGQYSFVHRRETKGYQYKEPKQFGA